jgi:hypothetical protein
VVTVHTHSGHQNSGRVSAFSHAICMELILLVYNEVDMQYEFFIFLMFAISYELA